MVGRKLGGRAHSGFVVGEMGHCVQPVWRLGPLGRCAAANKRHLQARKLRGKGVRNAASEPDGLKPRWALAEGRCDSVLLGRLLVAACL